MTSANLIGEAQQDERGAIAWLLALYAKKVAVLEGMKTSGHLTSEHGEWSLIHAKATLSDIRNAARRAGVVF